MEGHIQNPPAVLRLPGLPLTVPIPGCVPFPTQRRPHSLIYPTFLPLFILFLRLLGTFLPILLCQANGGVSAQFSRETEPVQCVCAQRYGAGSGDHGG